MIKNLQSKKLSTLKVFFVYGELMLSKIVLTNFIEKSLITCFDDRDSLIMEKNVIKLVAININNVYINIVNINY